MGNSSKYCKKKVNIVKVKNDFEQEEEEERYIFTNSTKQTIDRPMVNLKINDKAFSILIDSGAQENLLDYTSYLTFPVKLRLEQCRTKLYGYNNQAISILGQFQADVETEDGINGEATFKVVAGDSGNLLSFQTAKQLNLFEGKIFKSCNLITCDESEDSYADILQEYNDVLTEKIGRLKNFKIKLHIDKSVRPIQMPYRRLPYNLTKATELELEELIRNDIIEIAPGPTEWLSQMVVVPKPKKPNKVRITSDMRAVNKAIIRERVATPTIEEIMYDLQGSEIFSEIDMNKAFDQIELADEDSKNITAFETHKGIFRYKVLTMGIHNASEYLQKAMKHQILPNLKGVKGIADNIIVYGKDDAEHKKNLKAVLQRFRELGLTASKDNCKIAAKVLNFYGLKVSSEGVSLADDKVKALKSAGIPNTVNELRSFLGLAVYCSSHIPKLAILAAPLWELIKESGGKLEWKDIHNEAFMNIKKAIIDHALQFFNNDWITEVVVDASPLGIGAILAQINPQKMKQRNIVHFISRLLTQIEKKYSQVEKEGLACVWSCERLRLYLYGRCFRLITDNKAIELILSNPRSEPPIRLKRWALRLSDFEFIVIHKPGKYNMADYLSRHPVDQPEEEDDETERFINFVTDNVIPRALNRLDIEKSTNEDSQLSRLRDMLQSHTATKESVDTDFMYVVDQLSVTSDGLILRGNKLVLPSSLRQKAIEIAHEGHQGMQKTKSLLRTKIWFPKMNKQIEDKIRACVYCQLDSKKINYQPIKPTKMPERPWEYLAMDFYGPLPNGKELMVMMDEYSRMPIVSEVNTTSAENVIPKLDDILSLFGIPKVIKTDNGPPFNGHYFSDFANFMGFQHRKITPYHPQANGQAESFMKNIAKVIRSAKVERKNWKQAMNAFLRNYRSTPHATTGVPPSVLMFGTNRTNRLPTIIDENKAKSTWDEYAKSEDQFQKQKAQLYQNKKRHAKAQNFQTGDSVIYRENPLNKHSTKYQPEPMIVTNTKGSLMEVEDKEGSKLVRDASKFQSLNTTPEVVENKTFIDISDPPPIIKQAGDQGHNDAMPTCTEPRYPRRDRKPTDFYQSIDHRI